MQSKTIIKHFKNVMSMGLSLEERERERVKLFVTPRDPGTFSSKKLLAFEAFRT